MAHLLAIVNPHPAPVQGQETRALVFMSYEPQPDESSGLPMHAPHGPGYRISVHAAETGRELGRWVSDCALTVTQNALLWLSMYPWEVQPAQGSIDYLGVMDQVADHAPNPPGAPPRELLMSLALNFPGMRVDLPPQPPPGIEGETGVRLLPPPRHQSPVVAQEPTPARRQLTARPQPQIESTQRSLPAPNKEGHPTSGSWAHLDAGQSPVPQAPPKAKAGGLDGEELEIGRFLARSITALKKGANADVILDAMGGLLSTYEEEEEDDFEDFDDESRAFDDEFEEGDEEYDDEGDDEEDDEEEVSDEASSEPRYRPLLPGEIPDGMPPEQIAALESLGGDDSRLRAKLERTQQNNANVILRARRVAALNERAREEAATKLAEEEVAAVTEDESVNDDAGVELAPPSVPQNGGGKGRVTKQQLVEALVTTDPDRNPKTLMRLKKDELIAMM